MAIIKGPRSALSEFIKEHGIKTDTSRNSISSHKQAKVDDKQSKADDCKKRKRIKLTRPNEIVTDVNKTALLQDVLIEKIITNKDRFKCEDRHLRLISAYLSRRRMFNVSWLQYMIANCTKELVVYDCSMIQDEEYVLQNCNLEILELHQCGQLSDSQLNFILSNMVNLKVLRITGAYLVTTVALPAGLKCLDLTNCNRLDNSVIQDINAKYTELDELRLSYCYKITDEIRLTASVKRLFLDETRVTEQFYKKKGLVELSIQRCPNIDALKSVYNKLTSLNIDNIPTMKSIKVKKCLKHLHASGCHGLAQWIELQSNDILCGLEVLDISNIQMESYDFLFAMRNLRELNLSWCANVDDELVHNIVEKLNLELLSVFGCFVLTQKSALLAYEKRMRTRVVGNPDETKYVIRNL